MGHDVHGFFMALAQPDLEQQVERVKKVAKHLDIPVTVVDLADEFKQMVLDYFTRNYFEGKTPNPCVICNPKIKFGRLLEEILAAGCDFMATGHYARIDCDEKGTCHLLKGKDPKKDQSYFLHRLTQRQLARILMPLGEHTKKNVYKMAKELGILDQVKMLEYLVLEWFIRPAKTPTPLDLIQKTDLSLFLVTLPLHLN